MGMKLGTTLIREGVISPQQLEEALRLQVLYGGRLGTNLLEAGAIHPDDLARWLAQTTGFPAATEAMLAAAAPDMVQLIPAELAERYECIPFHKDGRRLLVALTKPADIAAVDAISFKAGMRVIPHIVPELVLYSELEKRYGIVRKLRYVRLSSRLGVPPPMIAAPYTAPVAASPVSQDDIPTPIATPSPQNPLARTIPSVPSIPADAPTGPPSRPSFGWDPGSSPPGAKTATTPPPTRPVSVPPMPRPTPSASAANEGLSAVEVIEALRTVPTREGVADTLLRFATDRIETMLLFVVRDGMAQGWRGRGPGETDQTARFMFPLNVPSLFQQAAETGRAAVGPVVATDVHRHLFKALRREPPATALVAPVLVKNRAVNLIYVDCLGAIDPMAFAEQIEEIAREIPSAYARQLKSSRQAASR